MKTRVGTEPAGAPLFFGGHGESRSDEPGTDDCDCEQHRGQHVEQGLGAGIEDVRKSSVDAAGRDPDQSDDNADSTNGQ